MRDHVVRNAKKELSIGHKINKTCIEIKLNDKVVFSHAVPVDGTPYGVATNDTETNLKIKQVLENALNQVNTTMK